MKIMLAALLCLFVGQARIAFAQDLPIKPTRKIKFTTTEGTYLNVDISHDGKTILFDLLGDIYALPVEGGKAVALTHGLAYNRVPVWSLDGKKIAYLSDVSGTNRLCVMNADGSGQRTLDLSEKEVRTSYQLEVEPMPAWTPDGDYVAVKNVLFPLAGGHMLLPSTIESNVQFSDNGQFLYYHKYNNPGRNLIRCNRSTGEIVSLANRPLCSDFATDRISSDGQWLAYVTGPKPKCALRLLNLRTGEDGVLVDSIQGDQREFKERFTFTPDNNSLLIGFCGKLHRIDLRSHADNIIPFQATANIALGTFNYNTYQLNNDSLKVRFTHSANMSPDGRNVVFSALNTIYIKTIPDGKPYPLIKQSFGQFQPVFSPDGRWIAYLSWSDTQGGCVWRIPAKGGHPERLTNRTGAYDHLAWSTDGRLLAVVKSYSASVGNSMFGSAFGELDIIHVEKKAINKLADSVPLANNLAFSPDGNHLTIMMLNSVKKQADRKDIVLESIALNGKERKYKVLKGGSHELVFTGFQGVRQAIISPDNRYIVYEINEDLYLVPLIDLGGAVTVNSKNGLYPVIRFASGGLDPNWAQGGKTLSWSYSHYFYQMSPDKIMAIALQAAKDSAANEETNDGVIKLNVVPDKTIDLNIKATKQFGHGVIALRRVKIISMHGDEVIENGTVVIINGRIAAIGPTHSVAIPGNARIFNWKGKTIMPGIIDLHDHCSNTADIFPQQSWKYLVNLAYGVTTARDPASGYDAFGYAELLQTGQMIGPRLFTVGYAVGEDMLEINSQEEANETATKRAELGAIIIKQYTQETRKQREWVLMGCEKSGLNMTNEGDFDLRGELAMMKDGSTGVEHAYQFTNIYQDVIQFIARSGTWHTPTLLETTDADHYYHHLYRQNLDTKLKHFWPRNRYSSLIRESDDLANTIHPDFIHTASIEAAIYKAGGHIGLGAHGNDPGIGSHWELWALQKGGLTNLEALKVATISGAEALGVQKDLGSLEPGKIADLIVLDKNPLEDIHNTMSIRYVMKSGILYDGNTLDELWPERKKCPKWQLDPKYLTNKK